jgi:hypothetical protein
MPPQKLWIHITYRPKEEMPVAAYFRNYNDMPALEHEALQLCYGKILDIGYWCGCRQSCIVAATTRQRHHGAGNFCTGLAVMKQSGTQIIIHQDVFSYSGEQFDTLLLQMNGMGLTGTLSRLRIFLQHTSKLLKPGDQLIFDSSDVAYVYNNHFPDLKKYYGEIVYKYQYKRKKRIGLTGFTSIPLH